MRTTELLESTTAPGGDLAPTGVHLGRVLRIGDLTADLTAALTAGRGTLDGSLTCIRAGVHGVSVSHRADGTAPMVSS